MGIQRCLVCQQIKESTEFTKGNQGACNTCVSKKRPNGFHKCVKCQIAVREVSCRGYCAGCTTQLKKVAVKVPRNKRKEALIQRILSIVREYRVRQVPALKHLSLHRMTAQQLMDSCAYEELESILETLEQLYIQQESDMSIWNRKELIRDILNQIQEKELQRLPGFAGLELQNLTRRELESYAAEKLERILQAVERAKPNIDGPIRNSLIESILSITQGKGIQEVPGFEKGSIADLSYKSLARDYTRSQLEQLLETVEDMEPFVEEIDPMELLVKYSDGRMDEELYSQTHEQDESWRKSVPSFLKTAIENWRSSSLRDVYDAAKLYLPECKESQRNTLRHWIADMSRVVFEEDEEEEEEMILPEDEMAEAVMRTIEMVILPHLEVLDRVKEAGGNVRLLNVWEQSFKESLKTEVKERDGWRCVVCEEETDLHVHHRIPRNLGGPNHRDNLVTLCASCHGAIETADVQKAFPTCWANYKRSTLKKRMEKGPIHDKGLLREEVEQSLENLRILLDHRDEAKFVQQVEDIQMKLSIIFYE